MKIIIIIYLIVTANLVSAQLTQEWINTYQGNGTGGYNADKAAVDKSGNFIIAGRGGTENTDILILKYSSNGNLLWERRYNGIINDQDLFRDMILDDSCNVYIAGNSFEGAANGNINWITLKYSSEGELRWHKSLDWTAHKEDVPFSITLDKQNNLYVAGYGWAPPAPSPYQNFDFVIAKYSNSGDELWTRSYNSFDYAPDWGYSVVTDDSNNAYVSGYAKMESMPIADVIVTIKWDSEGNQKWIKQFPRESGEYALNLYSKIDKKNNVIVTGNYDEYQNFIILKYNSFGDMLWSKPFYGNNGVSNYVHSIYIDNSSNIFIAGSSHTTSNGYDALTIKYAPNGDTLWVRYYDDGIGESDVAIDITCDNFGNVYLTGSTYRDGLDFLTLKYSSNGNLIYSKKYSVPRYNEAIGIGLDKYNNIFIAGSKELIPFGSAIVSIKYSQLTGIETIIHSGQKDYQLYQNHPNPFNPTSIINYKLSMLSFVKLKVSDIRGNEIILLVNEKQYSGYYNVKFDGKNLPSGIYFYSLYINNDLIDSKRMLLIK